MIAIIDYNMGNLQSVKNALDTLGAPAVFTSDAEVIKKAQVLILPGVGAAGEAMKNLEERNLKSLIIDQARDGKPLLGLCLGMQLLFTTSEEGNVDCLDLIPGKVKRFTTKKLKVPQIGWNTVSFANGETDYFYFVHSYYCQPDDSSVIAGRTDYDGQFCSVVKQNNINGVQFHPEKSGTQGLQLLKRFIDSTL